MDELQLHFAGGEGGGGRGEEVVGGPLTFMGRRPMTTGAEEVTTVDELQLCFAGVVGGPLTLTFDRWGHTLGEGTPDDHWSSRDDDRTHELQLHFVEDSPGGI